MSPICGRNGTYKVVNTGSSATALSTLKVRYYYTINGTQPQNFYCDWTPVGSANVNGTFVYFRREDRLGSAE